MLPSDEELNNKIARILYSLRDGSTARYKNPIEEIKVVDEAFEQDAEYEYKWTGKKEDIGFIGSPHYGVIKKYNEDKQKNEILGYTCVINIGVPLHVLSYVPALDCIAVVRADVYAKP